MADEIVHDTSLFTAPMESAQDQLAALHAENERLRAELAQVKADYRDYVESTVKSLEARRADRR